MIRKENFSTEYCYGFFVAVELQRFFRPGKIEIMIYCTQLIYIKEDREETFHQFEDVAIPIISKYNGKLLLRIRPEEKSFVESTIEKPYEVHLVEFNREEDLVNFMHDEERKNFLI